MAPDSSSNVIQVYKSSEIPNWFVKTLFTPSTAGWAWAVTSDGECQHYSEDFVLKNFQSAWS